MVAATADYRIANIHHTGPDKCVEDAKSAVRWLRMNARRLGIDPHRVVAAGGSSGATAAVLAAYSARYEPQGEDLSVSSKPDALVLFNPALALPGDGSRLSQEEAQLRELLTAWTVEPGGPPAILFYGTKDDLLGGGRQFSQEMRKAGNRVELFTAADQRHGFSNDGNGSPWHAAVLRQSDLFLASLGFLSGTPVDVSIDPRAALNREQP
jgi:acetyl esterase/lipase